MKARKQSCAPVEIRAKRFSAGAIRPFDTDASVVEAVDLVVRLRDAVEAEKSSDDHERLAALEARVTRRLHLRLAASSSDLALVGLGRGHRLSAIEREILLLLGGSALGVVESIHDVQDLQRRGGRSGRYRLAVIRALAEDGRLVRSGLVEVGECDVPIDRNVALSWQAIARLLSRDGKGVRPWQVKTAEAALDRCYPLCGELVNRARSLGDERRYLWRYGNVKESTRKIERMIRDLVRTLECHPEWRLHQLLKPRFSAEELQMLVVLMGKELGFFESDDEVFSGEGLARAASKTVPEVRDQLALLRRGARLRSERFVRVCGGLGDGVVAEDDTEIRKLQFELTPQFLEVLDIRSQRRSLGRARPPLVRSDQLVLGERARAALSMAVAQARHARVLLDDWGLGEAIPYGRAVAALFSGPPGVGKTAAAEAMAAELGRRIMVVSYAEIQNCYVGETEKNIVRTFREATEAEAVLFWDEADAMFFDRNAAERSWEVRDVNVLLQELERFQGLCILATNRRVSLDAALERRIAIKVEFERPDRTSRLAIWRKLLPAKLPLAGVDVDWLADEDLSGGEIKNVVLNAARLALVRGPEGPVLAADFEQALRMEREGRWGRRAGALGFGGSARRKTVEPSGLLS